MQFPICYFCLKSGLLCKTCDEKLRKGEITKLDIEVAKWFLDNETKYPQIRDCVFHKAVQRGDLLVVLVGCRSKTLSMLWRKVGKALGDEKGLNVRIVEKSPSLRGFLSQLLFPAKVVALNTIWLPDGTCESTVRVSTEDLKKLPADVKALEEVARELLGETVYIVA
ncbi:MAG: transcription elongation factor NusA [Candidatus Nezhaarchaeota archaeon]|nr:transcription elongation factor NusA [Candidatus Nezhaarchaeota archaeon]